MYCISQFLLRCSDLLLLLEGYYIHLKEKSEKFSKKLCRTHDVEKHDGVPKVWRYIRIART